ncbi:MAG TPA: molybdopterin-dependent oxidoreductase, partial [Microthrixaceae bacterium]|nr:molybdopterin-dependent oxidoreductase [Microthrixaceae bacterium]
MTRHVGARRARLEDRPLLTGGGCYTDDIELPRMAHAAIIRSPVANGIVRRIRSDRLTTPVDLVLGPDEIAAATDPYRVLWIMPNQWQTERPLYDGRVRFVGDPIGVVVAADRYAAEDALDELDVLIDELPPVVGLDAALADERLVYPDHDTNLMAHWSAGDDDAHTDAVFAAADRTLSIPLRIGRVAGVPIEPRGIVVDPGRPGWDGLPDKITVWTSTQAPHAVRDAIAEVCRLPQHRIRVIGPDVGGGFGVKDHIYEDELMVVLAAIRLGRPVKWIEDRRESLTTTTQARDERHVVEVAYDDDGALRGIRVAADRDCG